MEQDHPFSEGEAESRDHGKRREDIDWGAIEHDVVHGDWSLRRIAEKHGIGETTIRMRMLKLGWTRLVGTKPLPSGLSAGAPGVPRKKSRKSKRSRRREMVERLFKVLDGKMREIEGRMAQAQGDGGAPQSAADAERDARSLNGLARLYARLVELDDAVKQGAAVEEDKTSNAKGRDENADELRHDLALRLKRLDRAGEA